MQLDQLNWCLHCSIVNSKLKNLILLGPLFVQHPPVNCVSPRVGREGGLLNPDNCPLLLCSSHNAHLQHGEVYVGSAMCALATAVHWLANRKHSTYKFKQNIFNNYYFQSFLAAWPLKCVLKKWKGRKSSRKDFCNAACTLLPTRLLNLSKRKRLRLTSLQCNACLIFSTIAIILCTDEAQLLHMCFFFKYKNGSSIICSSSSWLAGSTLNPISSS